MKWVLGILFILLLGCTTQTPVPTGHVTEAHMDLCTASIGESCATCRCLKPLKCLKGTCAEVSKPDGSMCAYDAQCLSGSCIDLVCARPDSTVLDCKRVCPDYVHSDDECTTVCT